MDYQEIYSSFMENYEENKNNDEKVAKTILDLTTCLVEKNLAVEKKEEIFNEVYNNKLNEVDESTGKTIPVTKVDQLVKGTTEYHNFKKTKADVQNIQSMIEALKVKHEEIINRPIITGTNE